MELAKLSPNPYVMRLHYSCTELKLRTKLIRSLHLSYLLQGCSCYKGGGGYFHFPMESLAVRCVLVPLSAKWLFATLERYNVKHKHNQESRKRHRV